MRRALFLGLLCVTACEFKADTPPPVPPPAEPAPMRIEVFTADLSTEAGRKEMDDFLLGLPDSVAGAFEVQLGDDQLHALHAGGPDRWQISLAYEGEQGEASGSTWSILIGAGGLPVGTAWNLDSTAGTARLRGRVVRTSVSGPEGGLMSILTMPVP